MTYAFRNRFRLPQLDADIPEILLSDSADGGVVTLCPVRSEPPKGRFLFAFEVTKRGELISQADELVLQGHGYADAKDAAVAGRKWRQNLTFAFAREFRGVDFGPDDDDHIIPSGRVIEDVVPEVFQGIGLNIGDRVIHEDSRLLVFKTEPTPVFVNAVFGAITVKQEGRHERLVQNLKNVHGQDQSPWSRQKTLAYRLVHTALVDSNPETRHILLVTAVETMLDRQRPEQPVQDELNKLIKQVKAWADDNPAKKQVKDTLEGARREESINRTGKKKVSDVLSGTYLGKDAGEFFEYVYDLRSGLVHQERPKRHRPEVEELRRVYCKLLQFVLDLLDAKGTA